MVTDIEAFKNHLIACGLRPITVNIYTNYVDELERISHADVDKVIIQHNNKVCKAALLRYLVEYKRLYEYKEYIKFEKFKPRPKPLGLSSEEFNNLLTILNERDRLIAKTLRYSGFRVSEVVKDAYDKEKGIKPKNIKGNILSLKVKGGRWDDAECPGFLIKELRNYEELNEIKENDLIFPIVARTYRLALKNASESLNMRHVYPHLLKHTTSRDCVEAGLDLYETSIVLHHVKPNTTSDHYWRPDKGKIWTKKNACLKNTSYKNE